MIDLHCHILPGVDDGAPDMDAALEMARMAAGSGVSTIVATPHCNLPGSDSKNYRSSYLDDQFSLLQSHIRAAQLPLTVLPGAEVLCTPEVPDLLRQGQLLTLAGSDYLLLEFFFDESLEYMDDMLQAISALGITPVIAHPERYEAVQHTPHVLQRWFYHDYIIQLNKGSILGRLGRRAQRTADWILSRGLAHVVASDAHSPEMRTPDMTQLYQYLSEVCVPEYVDILLQDNPTRILNNQPILQAD